jgi:sugar phosphate isomerase/epimerase
LRIAYSTYALQSVDPFEAIDRVQAIGYDALELNVGDAWPTAAAKLDGDQRARLRERFQAASFPPPVLMHLIGLCAVDEDPQAKSQQLAQTCQLARDLSYDGAVPVVTTTLGGQGGDWDAARDRVVERLATYAAIAEDHGAVLAIEAHAGQELDSPEKAVWLVEAMGRESVRLNYDHSHFHVAGMAIEHCVELCAPYTAHTHLKDGRRVDGKVQFLLPGEGDLDLPTYFRAVTAAAISVPITVEVSGQIWQRDDYDPWATAERCHTAMRQGLAAATS